MLRILVAEDTPDNQLLVEVYMQGTSNILTFVDDGAAAVEQFRENDFDLVLMDVRMPHMDGLAATRAIRGIERERCAAAVPIIALTAGGWLDDIALCRDAGCTAHLSKPFSLRELMEVVQAHSIDVCQTCVAPDPLADGPDPHTIRIPEGLEGIAPGYLRARRDDCRTLAGLIASREFEQIRGIAHNMKGTGRSYGFNRLTELGAAMEMSAKAADIRALTIQLDDLVEYFARLRMVHHLCGE